MAACHHIDAQQGEGAHRGEPCHQGLRRHVVPVERALIHKRSSSYYSNAERGRYMLGD